jgi:hypothetical protein
LFSLHAKKEREKGIRKRMGRPAEFAVGSSTRIQVAPLCVMMRCGFADFSFFDRLQSVHCPFIIASYAVCGFTRNLVAGGHPFAVCSGGRYGRFDGEKNCVKIQLFSFCVPGLHNKHSLESQIGLCAPATALSLTSR